MYWNPPPFHLLTFCARFRIFSDSEFSMRSSSRLCFSTLTSPHRRNRGLPPLVCHWIYRPGIGHRLTYKTAPPQEAAEMTSSFVSRSAGGRNRTTAALASKRALVNEKCRYQRMSSISSLLVGEPILLLLPYEQSTTIQPTLHVLSSTTFDTLHTRQRELPRAFRTPLQRSTYLVVSSSPTLSIKHNSFNGTIYLLTTLQLQMKASFHWIRQELG